jgi:hypothetical protein
MVPMPLDIRRRTNLSVVDEELDFVPKGALACCLGLLEQWPHLQFARLLCGHEVFVQAQLSPCQALVPLQNGLAVFVRHEFEQHRVGACARH